MRTEDINAQEESDDDYDARSGYRSNPVLPAIPERGDASSALIRDHPLNKGRSGKKGTQSVQSLSGVSSGRASNVPLYAPGEIGRHIDQKEKLKNMVY